MEKAVAGFGGEWPMVVAYDLARPGSNASTRSIKAYAMCCEAIGLEAKDLNIMQDPWQALKSEEN